MVVEDQEAEAESLQVECLPTLEAVGQTRSIPKTERRIQEEDLQAEVDALIADARADVELAVRWRAWSRAWRMARVWTGRVVVGA